MKMIFAEPDFEGQFCAAQGMKNQSAGVNPDNTVYCKIFGLCRPNICYYALWLKYMNGLSSAPEPK